MTVVRNAVSNVAERVITAVLTVVTVPVQVHLLGLEAYGLLGFVASLQLLFGVLDFGLGPTIIREVAADTAGAGQHTRALVQTFSGLYWSIALLAGTLLSVSAPWIADHWLHLGTLPAGTAVLAVRLIALSVLLRWPVSLYAGAVAGAQRLDIVNGVRIAMSCLKLLGGLLILLWFRTVASYLLWLAGAAFCEVACYMVVAVRVVPNFSLRPAFSTAALRKVWKFSLHMNLISMMAALFVQADRLMISRLLPIVELGVYSVAYNLAAALSILSTVVTAALFPAFAQHVGEGTTNDARRWCTVATEIVMFLAAGAASGLVFYGDALIALWISPDASLRASRTAAILSVGFLTSAAVSVPYTLAVAAGHTSLLLAINLAAVLVYVPLLYWLVSHYGINGAAWAWVGLNAYYLTVMIPLIHRRMSLEPVGQWLLRRVLPFSAVGLLVVGGSRIVVRTVGVRGNWPLLVALLMAGVVYAIVAFPFLDASVGAYLQGWRRRYWPAGQAPTA